MRIEGTANILHPTWQIESPIIGGILEVGPGFPTEPGQAVTPGKVDGQGRRLHPGALAQERQGGRQPSTATGWTRSCASTSRRRSISGSCYHLTELKLKEAPKAKDAPYVFDAKGDLTIAGVTNKITMAVNILPRAGQEGLEITGNTAVKMTDYKVEPVDINLVVGHIKTGDEVKLIFKWIVGQKKVTAAATTP